MKIQVDFYEKTESVCPYCRKMNAVLNNWIKKHPEHDVTVDYLSVEEFLDGLKDVGVTSAPAVFVRRGNDKSNTMVQGNNPDILVDLLDGEDGLWEL